MPLEKYQDVVSVIVSCSGGGAVQFEGAQLNLYTEKSGTSSEPTSNPMLSILSRSLEELMKTLSGLVDVCEPCGRV